MLRGRAAERAVLEEALESARTGHGVALVLRGDPGIGKTALLRYAEQQAHDLRVLRAVGVEAEAEVAFAGLHQLLRPIVASIDTLPGPQADALRGALGLVSAERHEPLLIGAALLTLLADAAAAIGVLCVVDDAQWLDQSSLAALTFAARRVDADRVAVLFGVREGPGGEFPRSGLRELVLEGLDETDAAAVLVQHTPVPPAAAVLERLLEGSGGNPMALEEIGRTLTADQLQGKVSLPDPLPVGDALEQVFTERLQDLPDETRSLLVVAAAEGTGEAPVVLAAGALLGIAPVALEDAERAGLVGVDPDRIEFRHPLIRSAVYRSALLSFRQHAHRALAAACERAGHADRRAWHLAAAALGPDADVADALAETADRAAGRSGYAAAATALERSAALTADAGLRGQRLVDAAESAWLAGQVARSAADLDRAAGLQVKEPELAAQIARVRGVLAWRTGNVRQAFRILMDGVELIADADPATALAILAEAVEAASYGGDADGVGVAGARALEIWRRGGADGGPAAEFLATMAGGIGHAMTGDITAAAPLLRRGLTLAEASGEWRALMQAGAVALYLGNISSARDFFARAIEAVRSRGAAGALAYVLEYVLTTEAMAGDLAAARSSGAEALRLARDTGQQTCEATLLARMAWIAALRGDEQECRGHAQDALAIAVPNGVGLAGAGAEWALAALDGGQGRWAQAATRLAGIMTAPPGEGHPIVALYAAPACIEAATRADNEVLARRVFTGYEPWATSGALPAHTVARCRGLLAADPPTAFAHFDEALSVADVPALERAQTELLYGEALRRARRRVDAREHLRTALDVFDRARAEPLAERARAELRATGETVRRPGPSPVDRLTPQELQIARLVAAGASNREVAATLFVSPRTVEYHLYKLYPKLGIGSRAELADALIPADQH
jgi:DNA-binding CsgD family transcriptional regulator